MKDNYIKFIEYCAERYSSGTEFSLKLFTLINEFNSLLDDEETNRGIDEQKNMDCNG